MGKVFGQPEGWDLDTADYSRNATLVFKLDTLKLPDEFKPEEGDYLGLFEVETDICRGFLKYIEIGGEDRGQGLVYTNIAEDIDVGPFYWKYWVTSLQCETRQVSFNDSLFINYAIRPGMVDSIGGFEVSPNSTLSYGNDTYFEGDMSYILPILNEPLTDPVFHISNDGNIDSETGGVDLGSLDVNNYFVEVETPTCMLQKSYSFDLLTLTTPPPPPGTNSDQNIIYPEQQTSNIVLVPSGDDPKFKRIYFHDASTYTIYTMDGYKVMEIKNGERPYWEGRGSDNNLLPMGAYLIFKDENFFRQVSIIR